MATEIAAVDHFSKSPLPKVTTSLSHHFSKSPLLCDHFVFRLPPQNTPHPTFIQNSHDAQRFAAPRHKPACIYARGKKTWQHHAAIPLRSATTDAKTL